jgi:hypothetical protein
MAAKAKAAAEPVEAVEPVEPPTVDELLGDDHPYELVRAKDASTGAEYTTTRVAALNAGSTILDNPAVDQFGTPVPTKSVLDLRAEAPTDVEADLPGSENKE